MPNDDDKKLIILNLMTQVLMTQLDPTATTLRLRARLLVRGKVEKCGRKKQE